MAKKRRSPARARTITRRVKSRSRSKSASGIKPESLILHSMVYGGVRAKISNALAPFTAKIPLGTIADEAVLAGLGYLACKKLKNKTAKQAGMAMLAVESARIGEAFSDGSAFGSMKSKSSNGYAV